jgi:hypothetical protein
VLGVPGATTLAFVITGRGCGNGERWSPHSALRIAPGETVKLEGDETAELFVIVLPTIAPAGAS